MKYVRLYGDETGESHFEDAEAELSLFQFAPPSPPVYVSEPWTGPRFLFLRAPAGWTGDWHTAPKRQFFLILSGEAEVKASDGEVRTFAAGSVLLLEDTSGKGHDTNIGSKEDFEAAIVQLK